MFNLLFKTTGRFGYYSKVNVATLKIYLEYVKYINRKKFKDFDKTLIISGAPRSGTTWLAEYFHQVLNALYLHEPLHRGRIKKLKKLDFPWLQYIPEGHEWNPAHSVFKSLLSGLELNPALVQRNKQIDGLHKSDFLLIKFVRSGPLLNWLTNQFNLKLKPLYIVRHPAAVVYSQLNHGAWNYLHSISYPLVNQEKVGLNSYFNKHISKVPVLSNHEELLTYGWYLETELILNNKNQRYIVIYYEEFIVKPQETLEKIQKEWKINRSLYVENLFNKPSSSTQKSNDFKSDVEKQLSKWQGNLKEEQKDNIQKILDVFEVKTYSTNSIYPLA